MQSEFHSYFWIYAWWLSNSVIDTARRCFLWSQVKAMSFYDIVIDFLLFDAFDDLENPPSSVSAILQNRWLTSGFKETVRLVFIASSGNGLRFTTLCGRTNLYSIFFPFTFAEWIIWRHPDDSLTSNCMYWFIILINYCL